MGLLGKIKKAVWTEASDCKYKKENRQELYYEKGGEFSKNKFLENLEFKGKRAVVFGGTGGVGEQVVLQLLELGCSVVVAGRNEKKYREIFQNMQDMDVSFYYWDFDKPADESVKVQELFCEFGEVHIVINCVAYYSNKDFKNDFWNVTMSDLEYSFKTNLFTPYLILLQFGKCMREHKIRGHIVNICSITGLHAHYGLTPYGLTKSSMIHYTKGLALQLVKYGITVNGICPGPIATEMANMKNSSDLYNGSSPRKRYATPEEIASAIIFLASSVADNMVGTIIVSDGGEIERGYNTL